MTSSPTTTAAAERQSSDSGLAIAALVVGIVGLGVGGVALLQARKR